jgi:hypothetical protein
MVLVLMAMTTAAAAGSAKPRKVLPRQGDRNSALAISGSASSARNCIGPAGANVHAIGWVPANTRVLITFTSDFDPVAATTLLQMGLDAPNAEARASFVFDDDTGGNLEPELRFTTQYSGTLVLHVSKFSPDSEAGCYFYKVEVNTP